MWCDIYFSWTAASIGDEIKEKQKKKDTKRLEGEAKREGCCWLQGSRGRGKPCVPNRRKVEEERKKNTECDYKKHEKHKCKMTAADDGE